MIKELQKKINYTFNDPKLLKTALTHSSFANEHGLSKQNCNERLEFLGDSVLSIIVSQYLFSKTPMLPEGELTRIRATIVCENSLFQFAKSIELGNYMSFGKGEKASGGALRPSILADCFEAVLAALYLDGGLEIARSFVLSFVEKLDVSGKVSRDYKTELQEVIQQNPEERLKYALISEQGPDHDKTFLFEVRLNGNVIGKGQGHSKKQAEQEAARQALELMGL